jgi:hypothetical protein
MFLVRLKRIFEERYIKTQLSRIRRGVGAMSKLRDIAGMGQKRKIVLVPAGNRGTDPAHASKFQLLPDLEPPMVWIPAWKGSLFNSLTDKEGNALNRNSTRYLEDLFKLDFDDVFLGTPGFKKEKKTVVQDVANKLGLLPRDLEIMVFYAYVRFEAKCRGYDEGELKGRKDEILKIAKDPHEHELGKDLISEIWHELQWNLDAARILEASYLIYSLHTEGLDSKKIKVLSELTERMRKSENKCVCTELIGRIKEKRWRQDFDIGVDDFRKHFGIDAFREYAKHNPNYAAYSVKFHDEALLLESYYSPKHLNKGLDEDAFCIGNVANGLGLSPRQLEIMVFYAYTVFARRAAGKDDEELLKDNGEMLIMAGKPERYHNGEDFINNVLFDLWGPDAERILEACHLVCLLRNGCQLRQMEDPHSDWLLELSEVRGLLGTENFDSGRLDRLFELAGKMSPTTYQSKFLAEASWLRRKMQEMGEEQKLIA